MRIETVGVIGYGRFGRMAVRYLHRTKRVFIYDADPRCLSGAAGAATFEETVQADLILLCVPISAIRETCENLAPHLRPGQVVLDTCSVKLLPVQWMTETLPEFVEVLGTHPLFGPDSGKEGIAGLKIALCPVRISTERYQAICSYLRSLQLVLIEATPEEHDRQVAQSQAIFHLIAQAMKRLEWGGQAITTPGPESFFRLARTVQRDTDQLFLDLERENPHAAACRRQFIQELVELDSELSCSGQPRGRPPE